MSELYWMTAIARRDRLLDFMAVFKEEKVAVSLVTLGRGTANSELMDLFGLENAEKAICFAAVTGKTWTAVKKGLEKKVRIDVPGTGIAFTTPMSSIGGRRELLFLTDGQHYEKGVESRLKDTKHELLMVIANQGCSDMIMDAARQSGAAGGTVIHARGTGMERAENFLGISLASEKDIILIVVRTGEKNGIMRSIMEQAGAGTRAGAIVFSLPVTSTAGLRLLEDEPAEEEADGDSEKEADE